MYLLLFGHIPVYYIVNSVFSFRFEKNIYIRADLIKFQTGMIFEVVSIINQNMNIDSLNAFIVNNCKINY